MRGRPKTPATDPTWYRIGYSLAAHRLHAATVGEDRMRVDNLAESTWRIVEDLKTRQASAANRRDAEAATFAQAEAEALRLLSACAEVLKASGWRWVGCSPSRFVWRWARLKHRRRPLPDLRLAGFLDWVVEPAAVVLLWSARAADRRRLPEIDDREGTDLPLDRRQWIGGASGDRDRWLDRYLSQLLLTWERPPLRGARRLLATLGITRYRRPAPPSYRVDYNLACLLSRISLLFEEGEYREEPGPWVRMAAGHLQRSLSVLDSRRRERTARWAWQDPGLEGLQAFPPLFEAVVGPGPS